MSHDDTNEPKESLLRFPCDFTIKVFGLASDDFEPAVLSIVRKHAAIPDQAIQTRPSEKGKYVALNLIVHVESKEQLDRIYQELTSCPQVIMAL